MPIDDLAVLIGARLVEIESVISLGEKYSGVIIAKVVECKRLESSDHLNVTKIDDGGVATDVDRDENGFVQVVCGAPNVHEGMLVAWLPPNSTVPETFNDAEPFVLGARKLRGAMSSGMLASAKELDLFDSHEGILAIDKDVAPGSSFAEVYELNDYLLDIENKSLTHRPDTFGIIGFAREVAAIQGKAFETPAWLQDINPVFTEKDGDVATPTVTIDDSGLSARYQAVVLNGADGSIQSPLEIQTYLSRIGVRPVSAVVDVTNYLMMLTGQPLHAFDYDKLIALNDGVADIHVRAGQDGETLELLDGRTINLSENDIVIANGQTPVALGGAMGGLATEIDENTTRIIIESATFNLYNLRNTQMRHGIFSEAITRFTKGQPSELTAPVLSAALRLLSESTGANRISDVADSLTEVEEPAVIEIPVSTINEVLGSKFSTADVVDTLQNVEFTVAVTDDNTTIAVIAPYWRSDIHIAEDIIEEVGRLNGFDTIEPRLPLRDFTAVSPDSFDQFRTHVRSTLVRAGANEVLSYSFVHGDLIEKSGQKKQHSYRITNSISPDLQYYRLTLTPSLLNVVHTNIKSGFGHFSLFEMNKTHTKVAGMDGDVPKEIDALALTVSSKKLLPGAAYYEAKKTLDYLAQSLNVTLAYTPMDKDDNDDVRAPFEYRRSAIVTDAATNDYIGIVGEYTSSVQKSFKLGEYTAGFEIDPRALHAASSRGGSHYKPTSRYPSAERDICFSVDANVPYKGIYDAATAYQSDILIDVAPVDIYRGADTPESKNVTLRFTLTSFDKTLTAEEVNSAISSISQLVVAATNATII